MSNKMLQKIIIGTPSRCLAAQVPKNIAHNVDRYSKYLPSPLSVQQFLDFGKFSNFHSLNQILGSEVSEFVIKVSEGVEEYFLCN